MVRARQLATIRHDRDALRDKHVHDAGRFGFAAAAVAAPVEHQSFHAAVLHLDESTPYLLGTAFGELRETDVTDAVGLQTVIGNRRHLLNLAAGDLLLHHFSGARTAELQQECRAGIAAKMAAHVACRLPDHGGIVDTQNDVTFLQACFLGRRVLVGLVDDGIVENEIVTNQCTDACILAGKERLQLVGVRIIDGIRVERLQHTVDTVAHNLLGVNRVYVHHVQISDHGIENLKVLTHLEVMVAILLSFRGRNNGKQHHQLQKRSFHLF